DGGTLLGTDPDPAESADLYVALAGTTLHIGSPGVLANDRGAAGGAATLVEGADHGTVSLSADGSFTYQADDGYRGLDGFSYPVMAAGRTSAPVRVTLAVTQDATGAPGPSPNRGTQDGH